ncbi:MAG TPA: fumarylacetoacetate hydrolase family protein [Steroidobacteraceae bacterium]|jgi:2-keto-4-pentenoate hydratase
MIESLAERLREAERTRTSISAFRETLGAGAIEQAYAIQRRNAAIRLRAGGRLVGRKIGLTSAAVQRQLKVDQPDCGLLFADMQVADGGSLALDELIEPKVESEIAFVLSRDLDRKDLTHQHILSAVDYVLPCLEIVDSRIRHWDIGIVDTIADNASSARFVLGATPRRPVDFDFIHCGMVLRGNGAVVATGAGAACLGNPIEAVRWLAVTLAGTNFPLRAGDIVLSGALGPMTGLSASCHYSATIANLGSVTVNTVARS